MLSWWWSSSAASQQDEWPQLSPEDMAYYIDNFPFTARELAIMYRKFKAMCQDGGDTITQGDLVSIEEMQANPFATRICELFSEDGSGCLDFEKFMNMATVFSDNTPAEVKMIWAFAIWDFDGDDVIGDALFAAAEDIKEGISIITGSGSAVRPSSPLLQRASTMVTLREQEIDELVSRVQQEIDPDNYGLGYADFRKVLLRMPDFISNFHMNFIN